MTSKGQSLLEVIVVMAVGIIVVGALVFATIASLRNAQFAKNQAQATKLAQEGLEKIRSLRNRDAEIGTDIEINKFSGLYTVYLSHDHCNDISGDAPCYFWFQPDSDLGQKLTQNSKDKFEIIGPFERQVQISDDATWDSEKNITVIVRWSDFSGMHESKLTTVLRKL